MKKSLLAVAVLGAFAGTAMAADVTLYGRIDTGFEYLHTKLKPADGDKVKTNNFNMISGRQTGSRWGLKGTEELGNGYKVGFILESGFNSDTGMGNKQLFNREATLSVTGPFGKVLAGRMGSVNQGTSSVGLIGMVNAFGTSYGDYSANASSVFATDTVRDNMLTYVSPKFAGFQMYAQYAFGDNGVENKSNNTYKYELDTGTGAADGTTHRAVDAKADRYAAIAATYNNGPLNVYGAVDRIFYGHDKRPAGKDMKDSLTVTLGGNYDFGVVKVFGGAQYFNEVNTSTLKGAKVGLWTEKDSITGVTSGEKVKGFGVNLSVSAPLAGGTALAGVGYMKGKQAKSVTNKEPDDKFDINRFRVTVGYAYPFSKRTQVYAAVGYGKDEWKDKSSSHEGKDKFDYGTAMFGLRHDF
jgi:predicted porin